MAIRVLLPHYPARRQDLVTITLVSFRVITKRSIPYGENLSCKEHAEMSQPVKGADNQHNIDSAWRGILINADWSASPEATELTNRNI